MNDYEEALKERYMIAAGKVAIRVVGKTVDDGSMADITEVVKEVCKELGLESNEYRLVAKALMVCGVTFWASAAISALNEKIDAGANPDEKQKGENQTARAAEQFANMMTLKGFEA